MSQDADLTGETALVVSLGLPMLEGVGEALTARGAQVVTVDDPRLVDGAEAAEAVLAEVLGEVAPALVVISLLAPASTAVGAVVDTDLATWKQAAADPVGSAMGLLTALGRRMKPAGWGAVVFVAPSLSLVGGSGLVALSTALEGQRGLMKAVARQWGSSGVTVNWIAAAPVALSSHFAAADLAAKGDPVPVALGGRPGADRIAALAAWLASPDGRAVTGSTQMIDGGEWMVP